jgi:hypothetical protein
MEPASPFAVAIFVGMIAGAALAIIIALGDHHTLLAKLWLIWGLSLAGGLAGFGWSWLRLMSRPPGKGSPPRRR